VEVEEAALNTYLIKRLLLMIPTLFGVSFVVWLITSSAPEPPIESQVPTGPEGTAETGEGGGMNEAVKIFRAQYGLDKPAILNFYYDIDPGEARRTLEIAHEIDREYSLKDRNRAREQLIKWGYYAVPALVTVVAESDGPLRDMAMGWLDKQAQRVTYLKPGGRVDPENAARNEEITRENAMLRVIAWKPDVPENRKAGGAACYRAWLDGARSDYPAGQPADEVRQALDRGDADQLEAWGPEAVAALVGLVLADDLRQDRAAHWLARCAQRPLPDDAAQAEVIRLRNAMARELAWKPGITDAKRRGAREMVRFWWEGAASRWDYSGARWLRVLFLETQFVRYWSNLLKLDFGNSLVHKKPVTELVFERLKYSLSLALPALLLAFLISVPLGLLSATLHGTWIEKGMALVVFALYSLPSFFVGTLLVIYFARGQPNAVVEWIPDGRFEDVDAWEKTTLGRFGNILWHIAAPLFCMTYASLAALSRYSKVGLLNVIRSDYVRTARAKGLSEFWVILKHATRNGIIPIVTLLGTSLPVVVGGSFIIETIFSIPGFGLLMVESIRNNDFTVIIGISLIVAVLVMLGILLSDLLYAIVDPRISFS
jgi:peptide/nickel transport system permease protein